MSYPLSNFVLNVVDPLHVIRSLILFPASLFGFYNPRGHERNNLDCDAADDNVDDPSSASGSQSPSARDIAFKTTFVAFAAAIIIWASIFMYITFYYTYMPSIQHVRTVHIQFDACNHETTVPANCEFPHAFVPLTRRQNLLMLGQSYKIFLHLEMPETQRNRDLGMFMVCANLRDELTQLLDQSCRSVMLHYKSSLVRAIRTWLLSPLYVFDLQEEKQRIEVELFPDYGEDQARPVRDVFVEIQSRQIQFYTVSLHIVAHFTGLRYVMFHWPFLSAAVGICTNLFFILVVTVLSWYHWGDAVWIEKRMKLRIASTRQKLKEMTRDSAGNRSVESILDEDSLMNETFNDIPDHELVSSDDDNLRENSSDRNRVSDNDEICNVSALSEHMFGTPTPNQVPSRRSNKKTTITK